MRSILIAVFLILNLGTVSGEKPGVLATWNSTDGKSLEGRGVSWTREGVNVLPKGQKQEVLLPFERLTFADAKAALFSLPFHINDEARLGAKTVKVSTERRERETGDYVAWGNLYSYDGYNFRGSAVITPVKEEYKLSGRTVEVTISSPYGDGVAGLEFFAYRGKGQDREIYTAQTCVFPFRRLGSTRYFTAKPVEDYQGWAVVVRSPNSGEITQVLASMSHLKDDIIKRLPKVARFKTNIQAARELVLKELQKRPELATQETRWKWGTGGELVLKENGVATHTIWKKAGKWRKEDDGSLRLESDSGKEFVVIFKDGIGHVTYLKTGSKTTIIPVN